MFFCHLVPTNTIFYHISFNFANGILAVSTYIFRNSLSFSDLDRLTSCFLHLMPQICRYHELEWKVFQFTIIAGICVGLLFRNKISLRDSFCCFQVLFLRRAISVLYLVSIIIFSRCKSVYVKEPESLRLPTEIKQTGFVRLKLLFM